jgi:hypothetical protein
MFFDIISFYKKCDQLTTFKLNEKITLGEYLKKLEII